MAEEFSEFIVETHTNSQIHNTRLSFNRISDVIKCVFNKPVLYNDSIRRIIITKKCSKKSILLLEKSYARPGNSNEPIIIDPVSIYPL